MTRKIAVVDPWSMQELFEQTGGDIPSRMQQAVVHLMRQGVDLAGSEARLQRIQALGELLTRCPALKEAYSMKALVVACALCELVETPMNFIEPDQAVFDLKKFEREASGAEL